MNGCFPAFLINVCFRAFTGLTAKRGKLGAYGFLRISASDSLIAPCFKGAAVPDLNVAEPCCILNIVFRMIAPL